MVSDTFDRRQERAELRHGQGAVGEALAFPDRMRCAAANAERLRLWGLKVNARGYLGGRCSAMLGFAVMFHRDDDGPFLVSTVDVPMGLCCLLERIAPIDDRF